MKKYLPLIFFLAGLGVLVAVYFVVFKKSDEPKVNEKALIEVSLADSPFASLTPTSDGHYLNLHVEKFQVPGAESMDYELLYKVADGRTQGVPGTVDLTKNSEVDKELLLGSESSGKFRYDEGVEGGTLTLRFRNKKGKLLVKYATDFTLSTGDSKLDSGDGNFTFELGSSSKEFFVVMETFGVAANLPGEVVTGPYGVFSSSEDKEPGTVIMDGTVINMLDGNSWDTLSGGSSRDIGIFLTTSE